MKCGAQCGLISSGGMSDHQPPKCRLRDLTEREIQRSLQYSRVVPFLSAFQPFEQQSHFLVVCRIELFAAQDDPFVIETRAAVPPCTTEPARSGPLMTKHLRRFAPGDVLCPGKFPLLLKNNLQFINGQIMLPGGAGRFEGFANVPQSLA
jgi:hypothetical protein